METIVDDLTEYQVEAYKFARYKSEMYPFLGLSEEVGEVSGLIAKQLRKDGDLFNLDLDRMKDELGDVLWNLAACCTEMGLDLGDVSEHNLAKLANREKRGTIVER